MALPQDAKIDISVLFFDQSDKSIKLLKNYLDHKLSRIYYSNNLKKSLEDYIRLRPNAVIASVGRRGSAGLEFCRKIRLKDSNIKIILICSVNPGRWFAEAADIGADYFITTPVNRRKLSSVFEKIKKLSDQEKKSEIQGDFLQKLTQAVEQSPSSVMITDLYGSIEYVNPKFENVTGFGRGEVIGKNVRILKSGKTAAMTYKKLWNTIASGKIWRGEFINKRKNGDLYWEMSSISPIKNEEGVISHYVSVSEDVTERKRSEEALQLSERNLRKRNQMIEQDLKNAQMIQNALLPKNIPMVKQMRIQYRYLPMESVGGDYFSFTKLQEGGLGVFLGDVTGHGVSAALFLALVKAFTDRACRNFGQKPKEYFIMLNGELMNNMTTNFLTAIYGIFRFEEENGKVLFTFAKGGHPPPMVHRAATGAVEIFDVNGTILGMIQSRDFEERSIELNKGDKLFLYTDGIHETMDIRNNFFGLDGLKNLIQTANRAGLSETLDNIIRGVHRFRGRATVKDDIVLLGFEIL